MNKYLKYSLLGLAGVFLILQFFRGEYPETKESNPLDIHENVSVDADVSLLLKTACYDCHSMETKYPWYSGIAPFSWSIFEHIEHGRKDLNFSYWGDLPKRKKLKKLKELVEEVEEGDMPLDSYTWIHSEARLTKDEKIKIMEWAKESANALLD